ncbi:MAG: glycosyltransferase family 4 protein [Nevskiaceae bacterium]
MTALRLLVLTPEFPPTSGGGIVSFYRHLLPEYLRLGAQVSVLVGSAYHQPGGRWRHDGVDAVGLEPAAYAEQLPRFAHLAAAPEVMRHLAASYALRAAARSLGEFDLVEASDWGLLGAAWALEGEPLPCVVQAHGSAGQIAANDPRPGAIVFESWLREVERRLLGRAAAVHCYAPANREYWSSRIATPVQYLPPAQPIAPAPALAQDRETGYLVLARVQRWKGPAVLAEALGLAKTAAPVRWIGRVVEDPQSPGTDMLSSLRRRYPEQWGGRIRHEATLPWDRVQSELQRAGALIVPSDWDVLNFTLVEAMAGGCPVIASTGAGASHLIEDGRNGLCFAAGDARALGGALARFEALTGKQRVALGEAGRETVKGQLDPVRVAERHLAALREVAARPTPHVASDDLLEALRPRAGQPGTWTFLSQFPARALGREILRRARQRVLGK